jgi:predicted HicB family RNase H-like nuclease
LEGWDDEFHGITCGQHLYQSRFGAFFLYSYQDDGPEGPEQSLKPYTPEQARQWLEKYRSYDVDLIESLFGKMPEAGSSESKFTLRLPDHLRNRLAALAKANGQSLNAWVVRCLEQCSASGELSHKTKVQK